jgi:polar amino acid transport system permease protein
MLATYLPYILGGILITLKVSFFSLILTIVAGFALGLSRMSVNRFVRLPAAIIVEVFRGTSAVVQLFWAFYVLPHFGIVLSPMVAAVIVLGLNEGSYFSEVVRGAIAGVPKTQHESAVVLGFSPLTRFFRVLLPQALVLMIPPGTNMIISLVKFSSLVSLVTIPDLTFRALTVRSNIGQTTLIFILILTLYFLMSMIVASIMRGVEGRVFTRLGIQNVISPERHNSGWIRFRMKTS